MSEDEPIAWMALEKGAAVYSSDGEQIGKVTEVVADEARDIFSGVSFKSGLLGDEKFIPAQEVAEITTDGVRLSLSSKDAADLAPPPQS